MRARCLQASRAAPFGRLPMLASPCSGFILVILASGALCLVAGLPAAPTTGGPVPEQAAASRPANVKGCAPMVLA